MGQILNALGSKQAPHEGLFSPSMSILSRLGIHVNLRKSPFVQTFIKQNKSLPQKCLRNKTGIRFSFRAEGLSDPLFKNESINIFPIHFTVTLCRVCPFLSVAVTKTGSREDDKTDARGKNFALFATSFYCG